VALVRQERLALTPLRSKYSDYTQFTQRLGCRPCNIVVNRFGHHLSRREAVIMVKRVLAFAFLMAAVPCSGSSSPTPANPSPTVTSVTITGTPSLNGGNLTSQLIARATLSDGTLQDVGTLATWSSSNPAVATVSASGLVTAATIGTTTISAVYQGKTGTLAVSVLSL
jgi:hypothetical protein